MKEIKNILENMKCPEENQILLIETLKSCKYHRSDKNNKEIILQIYSTLNKLMKNAN